MQACDTSNVSNGANFFGGMCPTVPTFLVPFSEVASFLVPLLGLNLWVIRWGGGTGEGGLIEA